MTEYEKYQELQARSLKLQEVFLHHYTHRSNITIFIDHLRLYTYLIGV